MNRKVNQQNVYTCELYGAVGCEENKQRPCLVVQNNIGNEHSPTTIVLPISSKRKKDYPFHHALYKKDYDFFDCEENIVLCEQVRCIDLSRVIRLLGRISDKDYKEIYQKYCKICERNS